MSGRPVVANSTANSTIASRKFAIGPAATTSARAPTDFSWNTRPGIQRPVSASATGSARTGLAATGGGLWPRQRMIARPIMPGPRGSSGTTTSGRS